MNKLIKRSFSALMAMLLILSLLSGITVTADAATVNYQYGSVEKVSKVVINWGVREEVATFLSPMAEEFYLSTSYEELIVLDGSAVISNVPNSELYLELYELMSSAHTYKNSYDASREMFQYTDCENSGIGSDKISAFYSGKAVGPAWDSGKTWNREHTWPNSKGGSGKNEDDIMMLRPETASNNSSRGNKAYGESTGYFMPNLSGSPYDVRGDVARIILYVYVRWGLEETEVLNNIWGIDGVFESKDVLLDWMEEDPVDTWEMGRNDSVQSITGTRNVFVDYPELAFALFEEEIPQMQTPSGNAGGATYQITARSNNTAYGTVSLSGNVITATPASGYQVAGYTVTSGTAVVTQNGSNFTVKATSDCTITILFERAASHSVRVLENGSLKASTQVQNNHTFTLPAFSGNLPEGYTFVGWSSAEVSNTNQKPVVYAAGTAVTITSDMTFYAVVSSFDTNADQTDSTWTLVTDASQLRLGSEVIIAAKDSDVAMSTTQNSNNRGQAAITKSGNTLSYETAVAVFTLESGNISGSYAFKSEGKYLYAVNATSNYLRSQTTMNDAASFYVVPKSDGTCAITSAAFVSGTAGVGNVPMQYNTQGMFACYPKATQKALSLYVAQSAGGATLYTTSWSGNVECQHTNTYTDTVDATCTVNGSSTVICEDCGEIISANTIPAGHKEQEEIVDATLSSEGYTRYYCTVCGDEYFEDYTPALTDVAGWSLTLGNDVAVNFKLNVDASIRATAKVQITVGASVTSYDVKNLTMDNDGSYYASVKVSAPQMTEAIKVQIVNGNDRSQEKIYSVREYALTILSGNYPETTKKLVAQMLHYGAAAQNYFNYSTGNLANADVAAYESAVPATNHKVTATGNVDGIRFYGASMVFLNRIVLRVYFQVSGDINDYTVTVNGKTCTAVRKGEYYCVDYTDINPQDLDEAMTIQVNGSYTIAYSPMNYIVNMRTQGSEKLQALVQALYDYHLAAEAYLAV